MRKSVISAPLVLRNAFIADEELKQLITYTQSDGSELVQIYPLAAPDGQQGNLIVYARDSYEHASAQAPGNYNERVVIEVMLVSEDYDVSLEMLEHVRKIIIGLRNKGYRVDIVGSDEKCYGFADSGVSIYMQTAEIECIDFPITESN